MKTDDVTDRMGVYKRLEDVPDKYRLKQHHDKYRDRDVWAEFEQYRHGHDVKAAKTRNQMDRAGRYWKNHIGPRGVHHALAKPKHAESFFEDLLESRKLNTVYNIYFNHVESFYEWLKRHTDHPHVYNPVWMAVVKFPFGATRTLWERKVANADR
jgi:hypothetical protein